MGSPSTSFGPVQPFGDLKTTMGQRGRVLSFLSRALACIFLMLSITVSKACAMSWCMVSGSSPATKYGSQAAAFQELCQLLLGDPGQNGRIAYLIAVQVQDGKYGAIGNRVKEIVGLPGGRQRAGFRFAVAHHAGRNQAGVVENGSEGMD